MFNLELAQTFVTSSNSSDSARYPGTSLMSFQIFKLAKSQIIYLNEHPSWAFMALNHFTKRDLYDIIHNFIWNFLCRMIFDEILGRNILKAFDTWWTKCKGPELLQVHLLNLNHYNELTALALFGRKWGGRVFSLPTLTIRCRCCENRYIFSSWVKWVTCKHCCYGRTKTYWFKKLFHRHRTSSKVIKLIVKH